MDVIVLMLVLAIVFGSVRFLSDIVVLMVAFVNCFWIGSFSYFVNGFYLFDACFCKRYLAPLLFIFLMNVVILMLVFVNRFYLYLFSFFADVVFLILVLSTIIVFSLFLMNIVVLMLVFVNRF
jgi:hypothetical protein